MVNPLLNQEFPILATWRILRRLFYFLYLAAVEDWASWRWLSNPVGFSIISYFSVGSRSAVEISMEKQAP